MLETRYLVVMGGANELVEREQELVTSNLRSTAQTGEGRGSLAQREGGPQRRQRPVGQVWHECTEVKLKIHSPWLLCGSHKMSQELKPVGHLGQTRSSTPIWSSNRFKSCRSRSTYHLCLECQNPISDPRSQKKGWSMVSPVNFDPTLFHFHWKWKPFSAHKNKAPKFITYFVWFSNLKNTWVKRYITYKINVWWTAGLANIFVFYIKMAKPPRSWHLIFTNDQFVCFTLWILLLPTHAFLNEQDFWLKLLHPRGNRVHNL